MSGKVAAEDINKISTEHLIHRRELKIIYFSPEVLQLHISCIKNGDSVKLLELREKFLPRVTEVPSHQLQQIKYTAVAIISAIGSRLTGSTDIYEHIVTMIDIFIAQIDSMNSSIAVLYRVYDAFLAFSALSFSNTTIGVNGSPATIKARNYISRNLHGELRLNDIAAHCSLSTNYLSCVFKKDTGMTVGEYIMREKLREAEYMLISSRFKISEICYLLYFCSQSHFTQQFKKWYGVTPAEYKRRHDFSSGTVE